MDPGVEFSGQYLTVGIVPSLCGAHNSVLQACRQHNKQTWQIVTCFSLGHKSGFSYLMLSLWSTPPQLTTVTQLSKGAHTARSFCFQLQRTSRMCLDVFVYCKYAEPRQVFIHEATRTFRLAHMLKWKSDLSVVASASSPYHSWLSELEWWMYVYEQVELVLRIIIITLTFCGLSLDFRLWTFTYFHPVYRSLTLRTTHRQATFRRLPRDFICASIYWFISHGDHHSAAGLKLLM